MHKNSTTGAAETFAGIHHKFSQLPNPHSKIERCIYRVHKHLRSVNDKAYDPKIVSIGPYHRGKAELRMMEEHKLSYLQTLLRRKDQSLELYISAVAELEERARGCYAEPITLSSSKFVEMLVLDSCFVVELIRKYTRRDRRDPSRNKDPIFLLDWIMSSLQRDLLLFENQIPFFVLCKVYDLIEAPGQHHRLIYYVLFFYQSLYPGPVEEGQNWMKRDAGEIKHLLDLFHYNWQPSTFGVSVSIDDDDDEPVAVRMERNIDSATNLTGANVEFSKRTSLTLFDVEFEKGVLSMPTLVVEDRTECFFRNMIAYEEYLPSRGSNLVTDYARMMDCLINSSKDVDLLSKCGIIDNWLGDSEVVAGVFNKLTDSVNRVRKGFVYSSLFVRVNEYSERPWNRAMAVLRRDYFGSPWAYVTFFSAVFLVVLTMIQTFASVVPVIKAW